MQFGLVISVLFHVAILGGALISIHSRPELRLPVTEPVAIGMIAPGDVTQVKQGTRTAKLLDAEPKESPDGQQAKKHSAKSKTASAAPPPPPPAPAEEKAEKADKAESAQPKAADPPPAPVPAAEALKKREEEQKKLAEQQKLAEEQKLTEERKLAEQKKRAEEEEKAEAMRRAEMQKLAEEKKRQEEEQRLAEERKRAEEEQRKQAELKKKRDDEKKRREAALKKKREADRKRQEEEKKRQEAAAKAKQFDADKISALLNKVPDSAPPPPSAADQPTKAKGPTLGAADGRDKKISAGEKALLLAQLSTQMRYCWRLPSGGGGSDTPAVKLRWRLHPDGTLDGEPEVLEPRGDALFRLAAEAAQRAVRACVPFDLPPELYEGWRTITWSFDPSKML